MEKNPDEIPMFTRFTERGLALPASNFFKGLLESYDIEYLNLSPYCIFHTSVFIHFCEAFLGIKTHWVLFRKFFQVKPQPSANNPRVFGGADIQMRDRLQPILEVEVVLHHQPQPELPKPTGKHPKHRPWWNTEPTMQKGIQLPELLAKIKALRQAGLRAGHVAFTFMKRRVQPLMARDTLGYQYPGPHVINKLAIQPQIKHNQAIKTFQDHIKPFTHERAYICDIFQKHSYQQ
jgi:hypothetical protein